MEFQRFDDHYVLRLDPGEKVRQTMLDFVQKEHLLGGYFLAFGAFNQIHLRYFDVNEKQFKDHHLDQQLEVVSLLGNVAWEGSQPIIHMHAAVADGLSNTYSGHLADGIVRPTLEVFLTELGNRLERQTDPSTGLDLLKFG